MPKLIQKIIQPTLRAATLVEVLVSMVIILIAFGGSASLYVSVMNSDNHVQKANAHALLSSIAYSIKKDKYFLDERVERDNLIVEKRIFPYTADSTNLSVLSLKAFNKSGKLILERNELIATP